MNDLSKSQVKELQKIMSTLEAVRAKLEKIGDETEIDDIQNAAAYLETAVENISVWVDYRFPSTR